MTQMRGNHIVCRFAPHLFLVALAIAVPITPSQSHLDGVVLETGPRSTSSLSQLKSQVDELKKKVTLKIKGHDRPLVAQLNAPMPNKDALPSAKAPSPPSKQGRNVASPTSNTAQPAQAKGRNVASPTRNAAQPTQAKGGKAVQSKNREALNSSDDPEDRQVKEARLQVAREGLLLSPYPRIPLLPTGCPG